MNQLLVPIVSDEGADSLASALRSNPVSRAFYYIYIYLSQQHLIDGKNIGFVLKEQLISFMHSPTTR